MAKVFTYTDAHRASKALKHKQRPTMLFHGDCVDLIKKIPDGSIDCTISSPPYFIGKAYDRSKSIKDFIDSQREVLPEIARITKRGGSVCWEVGYHGDDGSTFPLDYVIFDIMKDIPGMTLRNRIVWTYGHGMHAHKRFSGRHEMVLWFTKGEDYHFNLDAVRVPQKYPGKRRYNGPRKGEFSGNPNGKNPSDVWTIPNVSAKHIEKLSHPCQFPVGLAERLVRALSAKNGIICDPYMGTASTGVAAVLNGRRFIGAEIRKSYINMAANRLAEAYAGTLRYRSPDKPIFEPSDRLAVARRPAHFAEHKGG